MLALLLTLLLPLAPAMGGSDRELDEAQRRFLLACQAPDVAAREVALSRLLELDHPGVVVALQRGLAGTLDRLWSTARRTAATRDRVTHGRALLAALRLRSGADSSLTETVTRFEQRLVEDEGDLGRFEIELAQEQAWKRTAEQRVRAWCAGLSRGLAQRALARLVDDAEDATDFSLRRGAIVLVGWLGPPKGTLELLKLLERIYGERVTLLRSLPELEGRVIEEERRLQEVERLAAADPPRAGRRQVQVARAEVQRVRKEAAEPRRKATLCTFLLEAASEAAGASLEREEGKAFDEALRRLVHDIERSKGELAHVRLDVLAHAPQAAVAERLWELALETKAPALLAATIDALAAHGDPRFVDGLVEQHLEHPSWQVRSRTVQALASLRAKAGIEPLIRRLDEEEGRLRTDITRALRSLTGQRFHSDSTLWQAFWAEQGTDFVVPPEPPLGGLFGTRDDSADVTFFGIPTESQNVLFVLDVSLSMSLSIVPRANPDDDPGRGLDLPQANEETRLAVARRELMQALAGIHDGGRFNVVLYATDAWSYADSPCTMSGEERTRVAEFLRTTDAAGATNIFGALRVAFDVALGKGGPLGEPPLDTIYFLSDGRPTTGITLDAEELLSYARQRNVAAGITIHTVGLSGAQDAYLLRRLAQDSGGTWAAR